MNDRKPADLADAVFRENRIPMTERNALLFGWLREALQSQPAPVQSARLDFAGLVLLFDALPAFGWARLLPVGHEPPFEVTLKKDTAREWQEAGLEVVTLVRHREVMKMLCAASAANDQCPPPSIATN